MKRKVNRRDFIKGLVGAGATLAASGGLTSLLTSCEGDGNPYNAHGLPLAYLGNTGVRIPRIVLGLGSRFCHIEEKDSEEMLNYALDNGFYYWDTAHIYDNTIAVPPGKTKSPKHIISEVRVGEVVKYRRKEIFLSTKVTARNPSDAMKEMAHRLEPFYESENLPWMQKGYKDGLWG